MVKDKSPTIMVVGAHHDDNELVAGTLALHKKAGWKVVSVVMTDGMYVADKAAKEHIAIREKESVKAAELLGVECVFLHLEEGNIQVDRETCLSLTREIRTYAPRIVITHPSHDYHVDHMNTSRCTLEAVHSSKNPCIKIELPAVPIPKLYYCDAWFVPFRADEYVDISEFIDLKLDMLRCHESQLEQVSGENLIEQARIQSRNRGIEAGVTYAEVFRLVPNLGSVRLTPLLGGYVATTKPADR